mmetsp:Transcript_2709/g.5813  ORF Transcript_2709/g.5813 Transcript_2709/m.5813 type:complete len:228 (-) Transcript_2709:46-729(-)
MSLPTCFGVVLVFSLIDVLSCACGAETGAGDGAGAGAGVGAGASSGALSGGASSRLMAISSAWEPFPPLCFWSSSAAILGSLSKVNPECSAESLSMRLEPASPIGFLRFSRDISAASVFSSDQKSESSTERKKYSLFFSSHPSSVSLSPVLSAAGCSRPSRSRTSRPVSSQSSLAAPAWAAPRSCTLGSPPHVLAESMNSLSSMCPPGNWKCGPLLFFLVQCSSNTP